ncbi:MAG: hypothetical protein QXZ41_02900 [Ignisphaera sp.]
MGISHPYLAILATVAFIGVVISVFALFLYIVDQVNKTPILGVYAEAYTNYDRSVYVIITIEHKRGKSAEIKSILLFNETSTIALEDLENSEFVLLNSCRGRYTYLGGICKISLIFPPGIFHEDKIYSGLVVFNEGSYPIAFTPMKPLEQPSKVVHPLIFRVSPYVATCINVGLKDSGVQANISEGFSSRDLPKGWISISQNSWVVGDGMLQGVDKGDEGIFNTSLLYYADLSIDKYTSIISLRMKLYGEGIGVYKRWGLALYVQQLYQQLIAFSVNTSNYVEVARYWVEHRNGKTISETLYALPLSFDTKDNWLTIVVNVSCNGLECDIKGRLYDNSYNYVGSTAPITIRFSESQGEEHTIFMGVFVDNVAAMFDDFVAYVGVKPLNTITIMDVPIDYIVELRDSGGNLVSVNRSRVGSVTLNIPSIGLGDGSLIAVKYPYPYNELTCLEYRFSSFIFAGSIFVLNVSTVNVTLYHGGLAADISTPISSSSIKSGVLPLGIVNYANESYFITLKLTGVSAENLVIGIYIVNSTYISNPMTVLGGLALVNSTNELILKSNDIAYLYLNGSIYDLNRDAFLKLIMRACLSSDIPWVARGACFEYPILVKFTKLTLGSNAIK